MSRSVTTPTVSDAPRPSYLDRLRSFLRGAPDSLSDGRVTCQIPGNELPGAVASDFGFLVIEGYLGQRQYDQIVESAARLGEGGLRRVGLIVDTGGGDLPGLDSAVRALVGLRQELGGELYGFAARTAGSAAYPLLASAARGKVFASAGAMVGGLGARMRMEDTRRLFEEGFLTTAYEITQGRPQKAAGAPGVEITEEQVAFLTEQVGAADAAFIALAAAARGTTIADMQRMAGEGGLYESSNARQIGLIDAVTDKLAFRALVAGGPNQPQETPDMERDDLPGDGQQAAAPDTPAADAAAPTAPPAASVPQQAGASPPTESPPDNRLARLETLFERQAEQIGQLLEHQTQNAAAEQARQIASFEQRLGVCVASYRLTSSARDAVLGAVRATIAAGGDAEPLVAAYEGLPSQRPSDETVTSFTFTPNGGGEPVDVEVDLMAFGVVPGRDGRPQVNREAAIETAALIQGAETPQAAFAALQAAFNQDRRF